MFRKKSLFWHRLHVVLAFQLTLLNISQHVNSSIAGAGAASSILGPNRFSKNQNQKPSDPSANVNNNLNSNFNYIYNENLSDASLCQGNCDYNYTDYQLPDEQLLLGRILRNYDPAARPVFNASTSVLIKFGFDLIQIWDMNERNQILTINVWLIQQWTDERLVWNKSEYNNLDKIRIPCNRIWIPDIVLYNSADDYTEGYMQAKAMVTPDGNVFWSPPAKLRSNCKIDVTFFPFDDQVCILKFGSWTYSGLQVDMSNLSDTTDLSNYIKSGEWDLIRVEVVRNVVYYPCCPEEPFPDVTFRIFMRRRVLYYLFNIILPCIWLSVLSLIGFWLPPDSGEKVTLGITVLLAFSVFMLLVAENIPETSEMVPLIGVYLTTTMALTSMSIVLTVFVLHLHHAGQFAPHLSRPLYFFMTRRLANWVGMRNTVRRHEAFKVRNEKARALATSLNTNNNNNKRNKTTTEAHYTLNNNHNNDYDDYHDCDTNNIERHHHINSKLNNTNNINNMNNMDEEKYAHEVGEDDDALNDIRSSSSTPGGCCCCYLFNASETTRPPPMPKQQQQQQQAQTAASRRRHATRKQSIMAKKLTSRMVVAKCTPHMQQQQQQQSGLEATYLANSSNNLTATTTTMPHHASCCLVSPPPLLSPDTEAQWNNNPLQTTTTTTTATPPCLHHHPCAMCCCNPPNACTNRSSSANNCIRPPPALVNVNSVVKCQCQLQQQQQQQQQQCYYQPPPKQHHPIRTHRNRYIESLEIFSKSLKNYLKRQECDQAKDELQNEWKLVALIVDRLLFWLFTLLTMISSFILLLILPILKNRDMINKIF